MMKTTSFKNMLAAIVALFITTLALPFTAQAQEETNYVTIDDVDKEILSTDFLKGDGDEHSFVVYLYLSADKTEYVKVSGNKNRHAIYKTVLLEDYESAHEGEAYWEVVYTKEGSDKVCFHAGGNPNAKYVCFSSGNMKISGDPRPTRKVCSINISDADITDNKHGDGQPHSLYVDYKYEREDPTAGTLSLGSATESSLTFNWTPASDNVTPQDKLIYNLIVTSNNTTDWKSVELSGVTSYTFVDLKPDTKYKAELYVVDESDNSKSYEDLLVSTTSGSLVPYDLWVAGRRVTSKNCNDLSAIDGVSGTAKYDPDTKTLTLDNANITYSAEEGYGLENKIDGLTLHLVGNNTLASEKGIGLLNTRDKSLIFNGEGKLTVKGAMTGDENAQTGMSNWGIITVKDCTLEAEGGVSGLECGQWIFENCTVRAKGGGSVNNPNIGSFGHLFKKVPEFKGCAIVLPVGAVWKNHHEQYFYLFTKDGKPVTDWVEIKPISVTKYNFMIAGTQVTSDNCTDLSAIDGVSGTVKYDPESKTLTLENAKIETAVEGGSNGEGTGIFSNVETLIIRIIGNNTITSKNGNGIWLPTGRDLTFVGDGKLTVNGGGSAPYGHGIFSRAHTSVIGCTLEVSGESSGLNEGRWTFNHCTVRAKGGGKSDFYAGSIGWIWRIPEFEGCSITAPAGAEWKNHHEHYFTLCTKDGDPVTDWVTISPDATAIDTPAADNAHSGIYTLTGIRLKGDFQRLPAGVYIVNGKKVVKH